MFKSTVENVIHKVTIYSANESKNDLGSTDDKKRWYNQNVN